MDMDKRLFIHPCSGDCKTSEERSGEPVVQSGKGRQKADGERGDGRSGGRPDCCHKALLKLETKQLETKIVSYQLKL